MVDYLIIWMLDNSLAFAVVYGIDCCWRGGTAN